MTKLSTVCYIEKDGKYLMLHRTVKKNDVNKDKWIGVGGHFEPDESPEECLLREVKEETGYTLTSYKYRGQVTFVSGNGVTEYMSLFTADGFEGEQIECEEGELAWVDVEDVWKLNLWEGDKIFFRLMDEGQDFFSLKLVYNGHNTLESAALNGAPMELVDVLNEDGAKTGIVRECGVAHREGSLHAAVHVWVFFRNGQEGYDVMTLKGHVKAGEDIATSAARKLRETLENAAVEELHYVNIHRRESEGVFHGEGVWDREICSVYVYTKPVDENGFILSESKGEEITWMDERGCLRRMQDGTLPDGIDEEELHMVNEYLKDCGI